MVEIKIQDTTYEIPTEWKDITLRWWYGLYAIISKYNEKDEEGNPIEIEHSEVDVLRMNRDTQTIAWQLMPKHTKQFERIRRYTKKKQRDARG